MTGPRNFRHQTEFVSVDELMDFVDMAAPGDSMVYATGDLACSAANDPDLFAVKAAAWHFHERHKLALTQRKRSDRAYAGGGASFDYIATRRADDAKGAGR